MILFRKGLEGIGKASKARETYYKARGDTLLGKWGQLL